MRSQKEGREQAQETRRETRPGTRTRDKTGNKLLREEERKRELRNVGPRRIFIRSKHQTPISQIYANKQFQVTRRFYPNNAFPITAKQDTRVGNHAIGQQGISEDAYGLTIALHKRLGSISPIPFCRMQSIGIGGQGFWDIGGF